jgi:hypothetical protein
MTGPLVGWPARFEGAQHFVEDSTSIAHRATRLPILRVKWRDRNRVVTVSKARIFSVQIARCLVAA